MTFDETSGAATPGSEREQQNAKASFAYRRLGHQGKVQLVVAVASETYTDKIDITKHAAREVVSKNLLAKFAGLSAELIASELDRIAQEVAKDMLGGDESDGGGSEDVDDASVLIQIATNEDEVELFFAGSRQDAAAYASMKVDGHRETWAIRSTGFGHWLRHRFYAVLGRAPAAQKFTDALNTIESKALFEGKGHLVHLRVAGHEDTIYVDLVNDDWNVVRIARFSWEVIASSDCPVRFIRKRGMGALPIPVRGGSIDELRPFVNCPLDDLWKLYAGSLPQFFRPRGPYAIITFFGEQGSAKSTTSKRTRSITDPSVASVRRLPNDERDLMIAASNAFALFFDNLSTIPPKISDALCSIATGGGFGTRLLYSDDEEKLIDVVRPIVLNGIDDFVSRPDLLDRAVLLNLPPIPEEQRKEDTTMDAEFEIARPRILGAIFDAVSTALRRYPDIVLKRKPRMVDFAKWATAAEESYGWPEGTFLDAYMRNRGDAVVIAIEASPVGATILRLMDRHELWEGTSAQLLAALAEIADDETRTRKEWPKNPRGMSDAVRRVAPALRTLGVDFRSSRRPGGNRDRIIELRRAKSEVRDAEPEPGDDPISSDRPADCRSGEVENADRDGRDDRDGHLATSAENDESADPVGASQQFDTVARQEDLFVDDFPKRPSQPSRSSRNAADDAEKAGSSGRSRDGQRDYGTVDASDQDRGDDAWGEA